MKSQYSEEYYKSNWERFIKKVPGEHYINLEVELAHNLDIFKGFSVEALEKLKKIYAKQVSDKTTEYLKKEMATIKALEDGKTSLGYTTQIQEIQARNELIRRFEFNCFQLSEFKKKYLA